MMRLWGCSETIWFGQQTATHDSSGFLITEGGPAPSPSRSMSPLLSGYPSPLSGAVTAHLTTLKYIFICHLRRTLELYIENEKRQNKRCIITLVSLLYHFYQCQILGVFSWLQAIYCLVIAVAVNYGICSVEIAMNWLIDCELQIQVMSNTADV